MSDTDQRKTTPRWRLELALSVFRQHRTLALALKAHTPETWAAEEQRLIALVASARNPDAEPYGA